ncbi:MAG: site-specific DNA-methyltransferase [Candidatus Kapaibacterium sp.]|nr:MAG: site-specific DNA-methyltransferase [Candidatus Kapabacteria bacterium]
MSHLILTGNALDHISSLEARVDCTFLDPPFNQQKNYALHNDNMPEAEYWSMMQVVCKAIYERTSVGGAMYFMQREKNAEYVLRCLRETGWEFQNLIIWKKKSSAVPVSGKYGKHYQIIIYATKGAKARVFNRLRISPPLPAHYKYERDNGVFVTDVWDDIRELTSGYFAGEEAIRTENGERFHKQQAPIALLTRMILSSTNVGDCVLDPFSGTGTTSVVAQQLRRSSISIEIDPANVRCIEERMKTLRAADHIEKLFHDYLYTENLPTIWGQSLFTEQSVSSHTQVRQQQKTSKPSALTQQNRLATLFDTTFDALP